MKNVLILPALMKQKLNSVEISQQILRYFSILFSVALLAVFYSCKEANVKETPDDWSKWLSELKFKPSTTKDGYAITIILKEGGPESIAGTVSGKNISDKLQSLDISVHFTENGNSLINCPDLHIKVPAGEKFSEKIKVSLKESPDYFKNPRFTANLKVSTAETKVDKDNEGRPTTLEILNKFETRFRLILKEESKEYSAEAEHKALIGKAVFKAFLVKARGAGSAVITIPEINGKLLISKYWINSKDSEYFTTAVSSIVNNLVHQTDIDTDQFFVNLKAGDNVIIMKTRSLANCGVKDGTALDISITDDVVTLSTASYTINTVHKDNPDGIAMYPTIHYWAEHSFSANTGYEDRQFAEFYFMTPEDDIDGLSTTSPSRFPILCKLVFSLQRLRDAHPKLQFNNGSGVQNFYISNGRDNKYFNNTSANFDETASVLTFSGKCVQPERMRGSNCTGFFLYTNTFNTSDAVITPDHPEPQILSLSFKEGDPEIKVYDYVRKGKEVITKKIL